MVDTEASLLATTIAPDRQVHPASPGNRNMIGSNLESPGEYQAYFAGSRLLLL